MMFSGATTDDKNVQRKAFILMRAESVPVSNEIDESELQEKKHDEQRI
jgi:hypothetical protein